MKNRYRMAKRLKCFRVPDALWQEEGRPGPQAALLKRLPPQTKVVGILTFPKEAYSDFLMMHPDWPLVPPQTDLDPEPLPEIAHA